MSDTDDNITMFVSKYALTSGITARQCRVTECGGYAKPEQSYYLLKIGRDVHYTMEEAVKAALLMKERRIKSLKKSLAAIEKKEFA